MINSFPTINEAEVFRKRHKPGFTDGKTIYINLWTGVLSEEHIEEALDVLFTHEFLHTIDMNLEEKKILYMNKILLNNLKKMKN